MNTARLGARTAIDCDGREQWQQVFKYGVPQYGAGDKLSYVLNFQVTAVQHSGCAHVRSGCHKQTRSASSSGTVLKPEGRSSAGALTVPPHAARHRRVLSMAHSTGTRQHVTASSEGKRSLDAQLFLRGRGPRARRLQNKIQYHGLGSSVVATVASRAKCAGLQRRLRHINTTGWDQEGALPRRRSSPPPSESVASTPASRGQHQRQLVS